MSARSWWWIAGFVLLAAAVAVTGKRADVQGKGPRSGIVRLEFAGSHAGAQRVIRDWEQERPGAVARAVASLDADDRYIPVYSLGLLYLGAWVSAGTTLMIPAVGVIGVLTIATACCDYGENHALRNFLAEAGAPQPATTDWAARARVFASTKFALMGCVLVCELILLLARRRFSG